MNLKSFLKALVGAFGLFLLLGSLAYAQTVVLNQTPVPPSGSGTTSSQLYTQKQTVPGGAIYQAILKPANGGPVSIAQSFVPGGAGAQARYLPLTGGKTDAGVALTATATGGAVGVARTAGTSLTLVGEATSSNAKTDKVMWEFNLPDTYVAGSNIPVVVNANYTGSGTITGASTTLTVAAYTETAGVEAALTVSAAQQFTGTATNYTFTVTGTNLVPGQHVAVEVTMLVTSASGANTGQINSVAFNG